MTVDNRSHSGLRNFFAGLAGMHTNARNDSPVQRMNFMHALRERWQQADTLVCVGLDPEPAKFPARFAVDADAVFAFCRDIADATAEYACAFKPQIAHFAALGAENALQRLIAHLHAAQPFLDRADRGVVILCRTSNPGAVELQDLLVGGRPLYQHVAEKAAVEWNANGNVALVVGATWPEQLAEVRAIVGDVPLLVPGVGAQGGDVEAVVRNAKSADGTGLMVSSSRAVLYASQGNDYAQAAAIAARSLRDAINRHR